MALKPCRECKTEISTSAASCPKCGAPVKKKGLGFLGWTSLGILTLLVLGALGNSRTVEKPRDVATAPSTGTTYKPPADPDWEATKTLGAAAPVVLTPASPWSYSERGSAMDDAKTKFACTTSINKVSLDWPYDDVTADLCVRRSPKHGLDVIVSLNGKGQILCDSYDGCNVRVRFDSSPARAFTGNGPSDNSTNVLFLSSASKILAAIKKSKKTAVEIEFYQSGSQSLEFNTQQLEWK